MLESDYEKNIRTRTRRKKLPGLITMTTMAVLLLLSTSIVASIVPLQAAYAHGSFFKDPKNISKTNDDSSFQIIRGANIETSGID